MIEIHLCRKEQELMEAMKQDSIKVSYTDDQGDEVAVSDDEDLFAAYEWAAAYAGNLKLKVKPVQKPQTKTLVNEELSESDNSDSGSDTEFKQEEMDKVETYDQIQEQTDKKKKKDKKGFRKMIKRVLKKEASALFEKMTS